MMWWWAFIGVALATDSGFYHPDDLASVSRRFQEANEQAGSAFQESQQKAERLASALLDYRESLDLLGERAPEAERQRLADLEVRFNRQRATLGAFLDTMLEDFDNEFTAARDRALAALPQQKVVLCAREVAVGPRVPGMRPRTQENPDCTGEDLNQALAARMDADDALGSALTEILALEWPALDLPTEPVAPIGGAERWIHVGGLVRQGAGAALKLIDREDDEARIPFQAAMESTDDPAQLAVHVQAARQVTAQTAQKKAALAEGILSAAESRLPRVDPEKGAIGWCAQPSTLGGCAGADQSDLLIPRLLNDRRFQRALP